MSLTRWVLVGAMVLPIPAQYDPFSDRLYRWYLLAIIVGAIAGVVGIAVLIWQTRITRTAAEAAKASADIAVESQRSWIVTEGVVGPEITHDWIKRVECHFKVIGQGPVKVLEAGFRFRVVGSRPKGNETEPDLPEVPDYGELLTASEIPQMAGILSPEAKFSVHPPLEELFFETEVIDAIKKWEKFACAYGFIRYRDAFAKSKIRETRFCYVYDVHRPVSGIKTDEFRIGGPPSYNDVT